MEKYIYKITNKENGLIYIGQTKDPDKRYKQHFLNARSREDEKNKILYQALTPETKENFEWTILEGPIENYNERERYWINFFNCKYPNGYNATDGGEEPPCFQGEDHPMADHSKEEVEQIKVLLKTTDMSTEELSKKFNYNLSSINRINLGQLWFDENESYPLRPTQTKAWKDERADKIIYDLMYTNLTQKEIGKKYGVGRTTITAINRGQNHRRKNLSYPIRK